MSKVTCAPENKEYFNLIHGIKSDITKIHYRMPFRFPGHYRPDIESYVKTNPKYIENLLIDDMVILREKKSLSSLNIITSAVTHFLMNDIPIMNK
jgi:hypothetical protein